MDLAMATPGPCLVICDRGTMDGKAYCSEENWQTILRDLGLTDWGIRDNQYDAVFHMVTAADGAPEHYTTGNNVARWETPEEACAQDAKTLQTYVGHPHLHIIDNSLGFEGKIERVRTPSEGAPGAVRQAVGGGCQNGWGRLLSVTNAIEHGLPSGGQ